MTVNFIEEIQKCIPASHADEVPWDRTDQLFAGTCFSDMKNTQQNPAFHGEGDVYTHTRMVISELLRMPDFHMLAERQRAELFLAALLHDIGKVKTTRMEDGNWVSPHHGSTGSRIVRDFLWRNCCLCGKPDFMIFRETVCALVRYHMLPFHMMDQQEPERKVREVAAIGELATDFSWHLLCLLAEADVRGRIADDIEKGLTRVELTSMLAEESGCLSRPYPFADGCTRRAYLSGRNVQPDQMLYDDTWGEIIMLSGLPGTGKDTWIQQQYPDIPMLSLDRIRTELGIKPTDHQGEVIRKAQERAKEHLRKKQSFVWNATNLTKETRQKLVRLFEGYGARVRIVCLETDWTTREARNACRADPVPETAVVRMLGKTVLPMPDEAQTVEWICV